MSLENLLNLLSAAIDAKQWVFGGTMIFDKAFLFSGLPDLGDFVYDYLSSNIGSMHLTAKRAVSLSTGSCCGIFTEAIKNSPSIIFLNSVDKASQDIMNEIRVAIKTQSSRSVATVVVTSAELIEKSKYSSGSRK